MSLYLEGTYFVLKQHVCARRQVELTAKTRATDVCTRQVFLFLFFGLRGESVRCLTTMWFAVDTRVSSRWKSGPWFFLSIDGFCCVVREGSINYIILCERHEVEFTAEIRTIVLLCLASFFSLCLEGTYVVLKQDVLCSAPG